LVPAGPDRRSHHWLCLGRPPDPDCPGPGGGDRYRPRRHCLAPVVTLC